MSFPDKNGNRLKIKNIFSFTILKEHEPVSTFKNSENKERHTEARSLTWFLQPEHQRLG